MTSDPIIERIGRNGRPMAPARNRSATPCIVRLPDTAGLRRRRRWYVAARRPAKRAAAHITAEAKLFLGRGQVRRSGAHYHLRLKAAHLDAVNALFGGGPDGHIRRVDLDFRLGAGALSDELRGPRPVLRDAAAYEIDQSNQAA